MSKERDLTREGYRQTETECTIEKCDGVFWHDHHTLVCSECYQLIDLDQQRRTNNLPDPLEVYRDNPEQYENSKRIRLPGGFTEDDVLDPDEMDGDKNIDPEECYA